MRMPRLGVAFRILAGLTVIGGLTAATSGVAVSLFTRFQDGFEQIATAKVPGLVSASQLAQQSGTIAANAPALVAVQGQSMREAVMARVADQIGILEDLIGRLRQRGGGDADLAELERRKTELLTNLRALNQQVERQLAATEETAALVTRVIELSDRNRDAAKALLAGLDQTDAAAAEPLERSLEGWMDGSGRAALLLLAAARAEHEARLDRMRDQFRDALEQAARHLSLMPPDRTALLEPLHRELASLGFGERNLFSSRAAEIATQRSIRGAVTRNQNVSDRLVATVSDYFLAIEQDITRRSLEFEAAILTGERAIIALALLTILGASAIFVYIDRQVVRRLRVLQAAMVAHESGQTVAIPTRGRDEIGDMARALQFFVTTIRENERDLRDSERRLRTILEQSPVGVSIGRAEGTVAFANARAAELAGVPLDRFVGHPHGLAPGTATPLPPAARGEAGVVARDVEVAIDRPDGSRVWALQTLQRTEFEGQPAVLAWSYDITGRKRAEEALRAAKEQAEIAARSKSEFLATMSHEIRTPMNGVLGMLELIALTPLSDEQTGLVTTVRDSATALLRIIDDILDLSKIEAGKLELEELDLSPALLLEGVADLLAPQAHQKRLALVCDVDASAPAAVRGDPGRLRQVLFNLTGNAIKFTEGGRVVLRVMSGSGARPGFTRLRFEVDDTGIGISAEGQSRLFQPFSQADSSTTRRFGGTGLGLAICTRLVERMGGRIGVVSAPARGSIFWFTVDLPQGEAPATTAPDLSDLSVIVAEGEAAQRAVLIRYLEECGAAVVEATCATDALELHELEPPDVLVLASRLPDGDAAAVLARLAEDGGAPPALLLTDGRAPPASPAPNAPALNAPGPPVLHATRPIHRAAFLATVAALAGRAAPVAEGGLAETDAAAAAPLPLRSGTGDAAILVAEDHPTNQQVVLRQLRQLGHGADIVSDGVEALSAWRGRRYRLLITDCHMPRMDGYELARQIRAAEAEAEAEAGDGRRTPIVAMTANALAGEVERCLAAGMDGYLAKPVTLRQLSGVLDRWLEDADGTTAPAGAETVAPPSITLDDRPALDLEHVRATFGALDLEHVRATFGALDEGAAAMLEYFVETTEPLLADLAAALGDGDLERLRSAAHAGAGAARTAGAPALAEACSTLERAAVAADHAAAGRALAAAQAAFPPVAAAIAALAASTRSRTGVTTAAFHG
ncbi:response regulator [Azospirillum sp. RWY-5-1]|uniref:response regulator n=1 Tax=Azospirillum oleiclasticum TaxID=2735135 RepID=UPI0015D49606|nr:response regulator [Azospirillum oleiclasticum]NYZ13407.1 response regulator [Azospirillum oleiclasticum]